MAWYKVRSLGGNRFSISPVSSPGLWAVWLAVFVVGWMLVSSMLTTRREERDAKRATSFSARAEVYFSPYDRSFNTYEASLFEGAPVESGPARELCHYLQRFSLVEEMIDSLEYGPRLEPRQVTYTARQKSVDGEEKCTDILVYVGDEVVREVLTDGAEIEAITTPGGDHEPCQFGELYELADDDKARAAIRPCLIDDPIPPAGVAYCVGAVDGPGVCDRIVAVNNVGKVTFDKGKDAVCPGGYTSFDSEEPRSDGVTVIIDCDTEENDYRVLLDVSTGGTSF